METTLNIGELENVYIVQGALNNKFSSQLTIFGQKASTFVELSNISNMKLRYIPLFPSHCILKNNEMTKIILVGLLFISVSTALAQPIPPRIH